jgi:hypothetical protein
VCCSDVNSRVFSLRTSDSFIDSRARKMRLFEGRAQRDGNRMPVNVRLADTESGNHLWAERFDQPVADLFEMQVEIVALLGRQLDAALISSEERRAERGPRPDSMGFSFKAWFGAIGLESRRHVATAILGYRQGAVSWILAAVDK